MKISCLIIDDEPSSQIVLKHFISDVNFLELTGVCDNAIDAIEVLKENSSIDLLFLDIDMPKISGLTFYKSLKNAPRVIFTTAYPQYAVDGFEVNAVDYLLKPFSFERFLTAVNKITDHKLPTSSNIEDRHFIIVKSNKILYKIYSNDILFIEAYGDYVKVFLKDQFILTNATFTSILELLPPHIFFRTHKSFAINFHKMNSIKGNQISIQTHTVPIGQKFKNEFLNYVNNTFT
ncbi:LytR/AlgR family response regulator transcription factor [Aegicerativicinus sediminis]|uniref:LytR/AlgR family response regulator transcription factor n=1 Tax=Aegicerativicinus sediminis TaxID=2893202 RepID=UPI001E55EFA7|nr:response regulator transcription factor [Aegicerativicinus sediminis]